MLTLKPRIHHAFAAEIWRMEIDENTSTLLLEIRDAGSRQVSFASVNLAAGRVNFSNFSTPERWLTGMEAAHDGVLLLHNYQTEQVPVHKGIIAVDALTAKELWFNYTLAFDHLTVNGPVAFNMQLLPKKLHLIDIKTGAQIRPYNPVIDTELVKHITVPHTFTNEQLSNVELPAAPYGNIVQYVEHNQYRIVSLHTNNEKSLQQHLFIMDDAGVVYSDLLNKDIQKLQPEAFVLHKNWLICLKNKTELLVLDI